MGLHDAFGSRTGGYIGYNVSRWSEPIYGWNGYPDHGINANDQTQDHFGYFGAHNAMGYQPHTHQVYEVRPTGAEVWAHDYSPQTHDYIPPSHNYIHPSHNYIPSSHDYSPLSHNYNPPSHDWSKWENQYQLPTPSNVVASELPDVGHEYSPMKENLNAHTGSKHNILPNNHDVYKHKIPHNEHHDGINSKPHDLGGKHGNSSENESMFTQSNHKHGSKASNHSKAHDRPNGSNHTQVKPMVLVTTHYGKHGNSSNNNDDDGFNTESDDESVFTPRSHKHGSKVSNYSKAREKPNKPNHTQVKSNVPVTTHHGKKGNSNNKDDDEFNSDSDDE